MIFLKTVGTFLLEKNVISCYRYSSFRTLHSWRVLFFGNDEFAEQSLRMLTDELKSSPHVSKLDVVTSTKHKFSNPVAKLIKSQNLVSREWPVRDLTSNEYDIGVVVSFGHMIPQRIISMFPFGMVNIHASLLPRWRGAAPIMYALMAGDTVTGVTLMKIHPHRFDVGEIISKKEMEIPPTMDRKELTHQLSVIGASLLKEALPNLEERLRLAQPQPTDGVTLAPKIDASLADIDFSSMSASEIFNRWRALFGITPLHASWQQKTLKLERLEPPLPDSVALPLLEPVVKAISAQISGGHPVSISTVSGPDSVVPGQVVYHKKRKTLLCKCSEGWIQISELCFVGKHAQKAADFRNGFLLKEKDKGKWVFESMNPD